MNNPPSSFKNTPAIQHPEAVQKLRNDNTSQLVKLLEKHHWNKTKVAQELGIGRTTLWRMLKNFPQKEED